MFNDVDFKIFEKLLLADKQVKNRYLTDIIDTIFMEELNSENENLLRIHKQIRAWAKNNEVPPNVLATYIRF